MTSSEIREHKGKPTGIRFTPAELTEIKQQAEAAGMSVGEYVRRRALGKAVAAQVDLQTVNELRRLGGLLKHVYNQSGGAYHRETAEAIHAIVVAIQGIERQASQPVTN